MCGKPGVSNTAVDSGTEEMDSLSEKSLNQKVPRKAVNASNQVSNNKRNETLEEKRQRRKIERKQRTLAKRTRKGELVATTFKTNAPKKLLSMFNTVWDTETNFVKSEVLACLPEVRQPGLFLDDEERTDEYIKQGDETDDAAKEKEKTQKFFAKVRRNLVSQGVAPETERAKSYQELRERLHRKIAELAQKPNVVKREKKQKKKLKKAEEKREKSNKGKKLISQSASTAGASDDTDVKSETTEKTPLKKKPVVKPNGQIVYSKFDFISTKNNHFNGSVSSTEELNFNSRGPARDRESKTKGKPTPEELLKVAQKHERQISNLETRGKKSEAVDLAVSQKWDTALKRAEGQKVRDDPYLLKKTIKKNEKLKQITKKKWKERVDRVEKQKELRQQKRQTNIQARKDDKKKRTKKLLRKRGRIA